MEMHTYTLTLLSDVSIASQVRLEMFLRAETDHLGLLKY